jgi:hypothetical protein
MSKTENKKTSEWLETSKCTMSHTMIPALLRGSPRTLDPVLHMGPRHEKEPTGSDNIDSSHGRGTSFLSEKHLDGLDKNTYISRLSRS